ncbi:hypothetical protein ACP4OV_003940 [Aristida adscensionis]
MANATFAGTGGAARSDPALPGGGAGVATTRSLASP